MQGNLGPTALGRNFVAFRARGRLKQWGNDPSPPNVDAAKQKDTDGEHEEDHL